jgi:lipocalin
VAETELGRAIEKWKAKGGMVIAMDHATPSILAADAALPVVPQVDLTKYAGRWYEIARLPNSFQRKCAGEVTANYRLKPNGKVEVINRCRQADGTYTTAKGTAKVVDKVTNAKLKVTFFWPFYGKLLDSGLGGQLRVRHSWRATAQVSLVPEPNADHG